MKKHAADQPIPFALTTLATPDQPVPYRVRVDTPSPALRAYVVPRVHVQPFIPGERESGLRLKVA